MESNDVQNSNTTIINNTNASNSLNTTPQSIQIVQLNDLQQIDWRSMGMVPLQTMFVSSSQQQNQSISTTTNSTSTNNTNSLKTLKTINGECVSLNNANSGTTFKLIDGTFLPNGVLTQNGTCTNIFSLDSETGTLKPLLIATHTQSSNEGPTPQNNKNQFQLQQGDSFTLNESHTSNSLNMLGGEEVDNKNKECLTVAVGKLADESNSKSISKQKATNRPLSLEEMSLNELREECAKRNLPKSGRPKQKLIERIREHMIKSNNYQIQPNLQTSDLQQNFNRQLSATKSPDSGVNMDGSPSFMPCKKICFHNLQ